MSCSSINVQILYSISFQYMHACNLIYCADIGSSLSLLFRTPIRMAYVSDLYISFRLYCAGFFPTILFSRIRINMNAMKKKNKQQKLICHSIFGRLMTLNIK